MIRYSIIFAKRLFFRNLSYSLLALGSLCVGITCALIIFLWVQYELRYDRQDPAADHVFAVLNNENIDGDIETQEETVVPLLDLLPDMPEVKAMTRLDNTREQLTNDTITVTRRGVFADSTFFDIFPSPFREGSPVGTLKDSRSIALSRELARLLFPQQQAVNRFVVLGARGEYKVTAVFENYAPNNSLHYVSFVASCHAQPHEAEARQNYYVRLHRPEFAPTVEQRIDRTFKAYFKNDHVKAKLFCLTDWRLHWNFENGEVSGGRIVYVVLFATIGVFILVMACVNYINLATARASRRGKEISIRKVSGAQQKTLILQFLMESGGLSFAATAVSVPLVSLVLPFFNYISQLPLTLDLHQPALLAALVIIPILTGILAGAFPAFVMSSLRPAAVIKGNYAMLLTGASLRQGLVVFQFVLSVMMIFGSLVLWQQTDFLVKREVGYDRHNVINVWLPGRPFPMEALKDQITQHASIVGAAYGGASPMEINGYADVTWAGMPTGKKIYFYGASADFDMIEVLKIKTIDGRNFSRAFQSDSANYVVTKQAAELLGFSNPIGQKITYTMFGEREGEIVGVIEDFHNDDIHLPMAPVIFSIGKRHELTNLFVRYREGKAEEAVAHVRKVFHQVVPDELLDYSFLDRDFQDQLYQEYFVGRLSRTFTVVSLVIGCLGLAGLSLFQNERRAKEVGIRKVLGASTRQVISVLLRDFVKPVGLSLAIALPLGGYVMQRYLERYPYRVPLTIFTFLIVAGMLVLLVLSVAMSGAYIVATKNPVENLKAE
ncbi:ABC transporter permease [Dawidia soli]|uniref:ABC transporter permease n=1 Tax=Dawidia soli TaxID=2782352 RepID=A0AAP2D8D5_9BACT|nr:ABC transporter permease [Dawidia soli]MBT1687358.1 ABC transporter permease [Dawidia soli]